MSSDLSFIITWWLVILFIGFTVFPLTVTLFKRFADKGYIFTKVIGILLSSYLIWLLSSLHFLPFTKLSIVLILLAITIVNFYLYGKKIFKGEVNLPWKWIVLEEILFFANLWFWSYVRANEPSIRGLEKFMDFGFVNSILRSSFFPPLDMWLTKSPEYTGGYFINYYYFGHYVTAFLTKLAGIDSAFTYNLMMATLGAFTFTLPFSIGANLLHFFHLIKEDINKHSHIQPVCAGRFSTSNFKLIIVGLLAGFLVAFGGNPHTLYTLTSGYPNEEPRPFWQIPFGFHPERYWYPNATRFIPNTIHEFPIYSFVVADLHGHVSDIPFVLLTIAVLLNLIIRNYEKNQQNLKSEDDKKAVKNSLQNFLKDFEEHTSIPLIYILLLGLLLSVMYMTNAWDGLIYMILTALVFLYIQYSNQKNIEGSSFFSILYKTGSASLFLLFFFLLSSFPFTLNFRPFVSGIGVLCAPKFLLEKKIGPFLFETGKCQKSPWWMMMILWGFFYYSVLGYLSFVISPIVKSIINKNRQLHQSTRTKTRIITNIFKKLLVSFRIRFSVIRELHPVDVFILIMICISTLLLIFPEFFYIKDIYPEHYRANTMFKLGYQAFMMLGISSAFIIFRLKDFLQNKRKTLLQLFYNAFYIFIFTLVAIYPYFAINSYYNRLSTYVGLDGLSWLKDQFPDDYYAIDWIRKNVVCPDGSYPDCNNHPVIAEAVGESYTDYARVSANTGLPTIVGWPVHEWLWRGSYDEAGERIPEVETLYESEDLEATKEIIKKYKVEYIFVGSLEKEKYPNLNSEKFNQLGKVVFESGETKVYRLSIL